MEPTKEKRMEITRRVNSLTQRKHNHTVLLPWRWTLKLEKKRNIAVYAKVWNLQETSLSYGFKSIRCSCISSKKVNNSTYGSSPVLFDDIGRRNIVEVFKEDTSLSHKISSTIICHSSPSPSSSTSPTSSTSTTNSFMKERSSPEVIGSRQMVATQSEIQKIKKLHAVRLTMVSKDGMSLPSQGNNEGLQFMPEYLVEWRDEKLDPSWELASCIAEDALRDFEKSWWTSVKNAEVDDLLKLDQFGSLQALCSQRDADGRTALHFIAGRGSLECAKILVEAALKICERPEELLELINIQDKDGYTPLHLAAGYMHSDFVLYMLEIGADPEVKDKAGRNVIDLTADLWKRMPSGPVYFDKRVKLQAISEKIDSVLYEEEIPEKILDKRQRQEQDGDGAFPGISRSDSMEYLIQWRKRSEDEEPVVSWEPAESLSVQLRKDYDNEIEYCDANKLLDRRVESIQYKGRERTKTEYLVEWEDGSEPTWEPLSHVTAELVEAFEGTIKSDDEKANFENEPWIC